MHPNVIGLPVRGYASGCREKGRADMLRSQPDVPHALAGAASSQRKMPTYRNPHAPNNVAKSSLIPDSIISRTRLRPKYGQGWQPRLDSRPRQADGRDLG